MSRVFNIAAAFVLAASAAISAQEMRRSGGSNNGLPPYNLSKETTLTGQITGTESSAMQAGPAFLVLNLTVDNKPLRVLLGPEGWVKEKGAAFTAGAKVEATGVADGMHYKGDAAMVARQIKVAGKLLVLRDADGAPMWEKSLSAALLR